MFCIQKTIDTPANIGRNLLEHGIPFRMSFEVSNMEHRQVPQCAVLGVRLLDYSPTLTDYQAHISLRNSFLKSSRDRLVLLSGGILWRLAMEVIGPEAIFGFPCEQDMCNTELIFSTSRALYGREKLTDEEIDLLCGAYYMEKSTSESKPIV
ncbi:hypothetical protein M422DRAFT_163741 [Sphaerobolus stellatus SS14]|nr:hypothetical protein M422DRAFT_163741 [Sphaerobolus stellatus SS14]